MHYGLWKYKCGWCLKLFDSKIECLKHNKVHRPRKKHEFKNPRPKAKETSEPLICADCGKIYQNKQSLRVHVDHFHNQQDLTFRCNQCENVYNSQAKLKEHIRYKHVLMNISMFFRAPPKSSSAAADLFSKMRLFSRRPKDIILF